MNANPLRGDEISELDRRLSPEDRALVVWMFTQTWEAGYRAGTGSRHASESNPYKENK